MDNHIKMNPDKISFAGLRVKDLWLLVIILKHCRGFFQSQSLTSNFDSIPRRHRNLLDQYQANLPFPEDY